MAVDLEHCKARVTALYNANAKNPDGSMIFSTAVADDRRHVTEIAGLVDDAAMAVLLAICETPSNPNRNQFMVDSAEIPHRGRINEIHYGPIGVVKIQRFPGDTFRAGAKRPANEIESMRENAGGFYAATPHNEADADNFPSPISGLFDVLADEFYYTGNSAKAQIAKFSISDVATKVPDPYRDAVISYAFALGVKDGDIQLTSLGGELRTHAANSLRQIRAGAAVIEPIPEAQAKGD